MMFSFDLDVAKRALAKGTLYLAQKTGAIDTMEPMTQLYIAYFNSVRAYQLKDPPSDINNDLGANVPIIDTTYLRAELKDKFIGDKKCHMGPLMRLKIDGRTYPSVYEFDQYLKAQKDHPSEKAELFQGTMPSEKLPLSLKEIQEKLLLTFTYVDTDKVFHGGYSAPLRNLNAAECVLLQELYEQLPYQQSKIRQRARDYILSVVETNDRRPDSDRIAQLQFLTENFISKDPDMFKSLKETLKNSKMNKEWMEKCLTFDKANDGKMTWRMPPELSYEAWLQQIDYKQLAVQGFSIFAQQGRLNNIAKDAYNATAAFSSVPGSNISTPNTAFVTDFRTDASNYPTSNLTVPSAPFPNSFIQTSFDNRFQEYPTDSYGSFNPAKVRSKDTAHGGNVSNLVNQYEHGSDNNHGESQ